jgi:hypothetical protein
MCEREHASRVDFMGARQAGGCWIETARSTRQPRRCHSLERSGRAFGALYAQRKKRGDRTVNAGRSAESGCGWDAKQHTCLFPSPGIGWSIIQGRELRVCVREKEKKEGEKKGKRRQLLIKKRPCSFLSLSHKAYIQQRCPEDRCKQQQKQHAQQRLKHAHTTPQNRREGRAF